MNPTVILALEGVAVAGLAFGGQWVIARYSKKANAQTLAVQKKADSIDGFDKLVHNLETRLDKVEAQNRQQEQRIKDLEQQRVRDRSMIRHLITYARTLRDYAHTLREAMKAANLPVSPVPEPPGGLDLDAGA